MPYHFTFLRRSLPYRISVLPIQSFPDISSSLLFAVQAMSPCLTLSALHQERCRIVEYLTYLSISSQFDQSEAGLLFVFLSVGLSCSWWKALIWSLLTPASTNNCLETMVSQSCYQASSWWLKSNCASLVRLVSPVFDALRFVSINRHLVGASLSLLLASQSAELFMRARVRVFRFLPQSALLSMRARVRIFRFSY